MDLYLIRHADAVPLGEGGIVEDAQRPLTPNGQAQAKTVAAGLQRRGVKLDRLVSSPLVRARETAEGIAQAWSGGAPEVLTCDDLAPEGKRRRISRFLGELGMQSVGLVGHEPDLGMLLAWLIGSRRAQVEMAKAGVAYLSSESFPAKGDARLVWLITPEMWGA